MNQVYRYIGYRKQAFHQKMDRRLHEREQELLLLPLIIELRGEHPEVSARQLYEILKPENIGRDKFERICFQHGLKLERQKAYKRTTDSTGVIRFPNLIAAREFMGINQAWSSDITYYQIEGSVYYITFIMDLFSRMIVGFAVSRRLMTEQTTIPAIRMALTQRNPPPGLIFHSDAGGQYYCKEFLRITQQHQMRNSMCDSVFENAHAERINGTIKNQYLKGYKPNTYQSLVKMTRRAVNNYNQVRPHSSLGKLSPQAFEKLLPAGGSSLPTDIFCNDNNQHRLHKKIHQLPTRSIIKDIKPVKKTVNVF
jgi:putative transposase